jgi:uroporphyrinogen-III decarboxylase
VVEEACEAGVDCFRIVGGEYATQLMGPRAWAELIAPYDRPLVEMIHNHGAIAHYHNHGNMQAFIERIAQLRVDSLDPIEQPPYGDMEMDEAMQRIGDRVCLVGGLDDMEVLETRPPREVRAMAADLIERVGTVGYMLGGTSSGIYGEQAAQSFMMLVEVAEAYA